MFRGFSAFLVSALAAPVIAASDSLIGSAAAAPTASGPIFEDFLGPVGAPPNPALWTADIGPSSVHGWERGSLQTYTDFSGEHPVGRSREPGDHSAENSGRIHLGSARHPREAQLSVRNRGGTHEAAGRAGLWPAFWMLGENIEQVGWPESGEIDIIELVNDPTTFNIALHAPGADVEAKGPIPDMSADYHNYWMTRREHSITVGVDDNTLATFTPDSMPEGSRWVFESPMFALINVAVGGDWPGPRTTRPHSPRR